MLFNKKEPQPSLTQPEREALVDLLHLCLYADAHLSLRETAFISRTIDRIGWDVSLSFSSYEARSIAAARSARADPESLQQFVQDAAARLKSPHARTLALSLCRDLTASDGSDARENTLLREIEGALT